MSEKGGKGYTPLVQGGKSALKSPRKDDSSAKSKRGRKVQFDAEDSFDAKINAAMSGGKTDNPFTKGNLGKGSKGEKSANGGKGPVAIALPPLELRVEQELPENTKCMMDCEAAEILQGVQDNMAALSADPTIKIPTSFHRALQYAARGNHYKKPQSVKLVLEALKKHNVTDGEMCMIANTAPESVDVVFALVPSFKVLELYGMPGFDVQDNGQEKQA